jgi:hypothetical protein
VEFCNVVMMGKVDLEADSFFLEHTCSCTPGNYTFERNLRVSHEAIQRLLGDFRPVLPYSAADQEPLPLRGHHERTLTIFRWECEQLASVEEFLLFTKRPQQAR